MNNDSLHTLSREQLAGAIEKALAEIDDSYQDVINTADLWEWAGNKTQENPCRCFAAGLDIAKQLLAQALKAVTSTGEVSNPSGKSKSNAVSNKT